jgi:hypothetical protein
MKFATEFEAHYTVMELRRKREGSMLDLRF